MSHIRSRNTSLEEAVFKYLRREKIYFFKHYSKAPGVSDIALPRKMRAVFIDGDFWHGWKFEKRGGSLPKVYWREKIAGNIHRDRLRRAKLKRMGWAVLRVWEHEMKRSPDTSLLKIKKFLTK